MGLLDSILGGFGGSGSGGSSATSPLVKALLVMLAAKAVSSHFGGHSTPPAPSGTAPSQPTGKIEDGMLAGMPSLDSILDHFRGSGGADKVDSWVGTGPNKPLAPQEVPAALGPDAIDRLQQQTGLPRDQLLQQVSALLPQLIDKLTPDGHVPPANARTHW